MNSLSDSYRELLPACLPSAGKPAGKTSVSIFMIVRRKALMAAEEFVTIVKGRNQGKSINQKIMLLIWQL